MATGAVAALGSGVCSFAYVQASKPHSDGLEVLAFFPILFVGSLILRASPLLRRGTSVLLFGAGAALATASVVLLATRSLDPGRLIRWSIVSFVFAAAGAALGAVAKYALWRWASSAPTPLPGRVERLLQ